MKVKILSCILINCVLVLSNSFCCGISITVNNTNTYKSAISFCTNKNAGSFINSALDWVIFDIPKEYNIPSGFHTYITTTNLDSIPKQLQTWYPIIGYCRSFFILNESYYSLLKDKDIPNEKLPNKCKKLLYGNIKELKTKCNMQVAQKLSLLTAINTSWEDALSSIREIINENTPLSHNYTLTEALFILHLKPSQSCFKILANYINPINYVKKSNYKDEDVLFYAECITGALARVLKYEGRISSDFKFDLKKDIKKKNSNLLKNNNNSVNDDDSIKDNNDSTKDSDEKSSLIKKHNNKKSKKESKKDNGEESYFIGNVKKLMQAYKDNFIEEQNRMKMK